MKIKFDTKVCVCAAVDRNLHNVKPFLWLSSLVWLNGCFVVWLLQLRKLIHAAYTYRAVFFTLLIIYFVALCRRNHHHSYLAGAHLYIIILVAIHETFYYIYQFIDITYKSSASHTTKQKKTKSNKLKPAAFYVRVSRQYFHHNRPHTFL